MCLCTGVLEVAAVIAIGAAIAKRQAASVIPNPGSDEALAAGCQCPVMDNGHGRGSSWGPGKFWINADCPLHGGKGEK